MGASFEITAYGQERACASGIAAAFSEVDRIERLLTVYKPESELARLNRYARKGFVRLDPEMLEILSEALRYAEASGGAYDPTAGPLIDLWGFGPAGQCSSPPSKEIIRSRLRSVGHQGVRIDPDVGGVFLLRESMALNLGGIGKGYALDQAVRILKSHEITRGLVSFGSTLYAWGAPPGTTGWSIAIQDPRRENRQIETVILRDQALSTSGDYERCFFYKGKRFSHIIHPKKGYPVTGVASVSVIAPSAMSSDVLSTAAFVLGPKKGKKLIMRFAGVEGLILPEENGKALNAKKTPGWAAYSLPRPIARRRFLAMTCAALITLVLPIGVDAAIRFATKEAALGRLMPEAEAFEAQHVELSREQLSQAQQLAKKGFRKKNYRWWIGRKGKDAVGYAVLLNVRGKKRPITFLVGIDPIGQIRGVEVLIYRESEGAGIRYPQFMKQFLDKTKESTLRLGGDIRALSGATLSSRAATYAVRKALSLFEVIYMKERAL